MEANPEHRNMDGRSYAQYCPVAIGLDVIGERWALLIIRELLFGPRRYTDLAESLDGISTSLLGRRLNALMRNGLVEKTRLPPPAASAVYQLTPRGHSLRPVVLAIGRFGKQFMGTMEEYSLRPDLLLNTLKEFRRGAVPTELDARYVLRVDGRAFTLHVREGSFTIERGEIQGSDAAIEIDVETLFELAWGRLTPAQAEGRCHGEGDVEQVLKILAPH